LKRWASCQLVPPSRPPLWPTELLSVLQSFLEQPKPQTHRAPERGAIDIKGKGVVLTYLLKGAGRFHIPERGFTEML
jgi:hypothetical protein